MSHPHSHLPRFMNKLSRASLRELAGLFPQFRNMRDWLGHPQRNRYFPPLGGFLDVPASDHQPRLFLQSNSRQGGGLDQQPLPQAGFHQHLRLLPGQEQAGFD